MKNFNSISDFREISHKADAEVIVYGLTLTDLFLNALQAMYHIMDIQCQDFQIEESSLKLQSCDPESLLVMFLSELLFLAEKGKKILIKEIKIDNNKVSISFLTAPIIAIGNDLKAVTFNEMKIIKKSGAFQTRIVFDL